MTAVDRAVAEGNGIYDDFRKNFAQQYPNGELVAPNEGRQEDFLSLPDEIFEALYGGAAYSGKSWILTMLPLFRGFYKYRGFKGIILRRKFPDLEREIIRLSQEWYPQTGGVYNQQKHSWHWPAYQSYMDFGHVKNASDISMYDSAQYNYCSFDETTHFPEYPYIYMVGSRVRSGTAHCNISIVRNGTNPGGIGQTFVYNRFVRWDENGYKRIRDRHTGLERIFIPAFLADNPKGMQYDPLYAQKLEMLPDAERKAKKYGDWHAFRGSVFTTFRPIRFPGEPDNALHVCSRFDIPEWWPKILSIDWGKRAMCHAMWAAISPAGRAYIYRERAWFGKDIPIWAGEIREMQHAEPENIIAFVICSSAFQDRGDGSIAALVATHSGMVPTSSENVKGSRVETLQTVHDFLRWERKPTLKARGELYDIAKAQEIYRLHGPEALGRYQKMFIDEEDNQEIPILQILASEDGLTSCAPYLVEAIPAAIYDDKKIEDYAEYDGDDPLDNLRYLCKTVKKYLKGEIGDRSAEIQRQKIIEQHEQDQDMTAFYRRMEKLEKTHGIVGASSMPIPLSRYGRRRRH